MRRIGILTSGGDAPGMNPALRAVARTALFAGLDVVGFERGYAGLIEDRAVRLDHARVGGILQRGGTVLQTARSREFATKAGLRRAVRVLRKRRIDALVVIGGDGSYRGAMALAGAGIPVAGVPGSIDNDLWGTDMAIGTDTALNTIVRAIDSIRDTASSHRRAFVVETMGRGSGYLALMSAIATGAEAVLIPEAPLKLRRVAATLRRGFDEGKTNGLVVLAEGAGKAAEVGEALARMSRLEIRVTVLGHLQRGGAPSVFDRLLASRMGAAAVHGLREGQSGFAVGLEGAEIRHYPLEKACARMKPLKTELVRLAERLA